MVALSYGAGPEKKVSAPWIVQEGPGKYTLVFHGCRVSQKQMAEICALIQEGKRISAIEY